MLKGMWRKRTIYTTFSFQEKKHNFRGKKRCSNKENWLSMKICSCEHAGYLHLEFYTCNNLSTLTHYQHLNYLHTLIIFRAGVCCRCVSTVSSAFLVDLQCIRYTVAAFFLSASSGPSTTLTNHSTSIITVHYIFLHI